MRLNILFTSVGNLAFPLARTCLKQSFPDCKLVGIDITSSAHGLYFCDKAYIVKKRSNKGFKEQLFKILEDEKINMLYPLSTIDQDYYSAIAPELEERGIKVVASRKEAVRIVNNKFLLYAEAEKRGLPCPGFTYLKKEEDLISHLTADSPLVLKPATGKGGSNLFIVAKDKSALREDDVKWFASLDDVRQSPENFFIGEGMLLSEYLPGDEYSVDILSKEGSVFYGVVRKRYASIGGLALDAEVVDEPDVYKTAKEFVEEFGLSFINNIQLKRDTNGVAKIMEINPRIPGTLLLSISATRDFISDSVRLVLGEQVESNITPLFGKRVIRYQSGVIIDKVRANELVDLRSVEDG